MCDFIIIFSAFQTMRSNKKIYIKHLCSVKRKKKKKERQKKKRMKREARVKGDWSAYACFIRLN